MDFWSVLVSIFGGCALYRVVVSLADGEYRMSAGVLSVYCAYVLGTFLLFKGGLGENYGQGEREGVLFKASVKGVVWKSYEFTMGTGAAEVNTWEFSSRDPELAKVLEGAIGRKCRISYREWWDRPVYLSSDYEAINVSCESPSVLKGLR
jgi:hypothetical protein